MASTALPRGRRRSRTGYGGPVQGWLYAAPTAIFVPLLFIVPLVLVFQMSASDWPLLSGNQGVNFPDNYV
ncbi:MAG TPA: sugar ABC transporter permease, partial [Microbacterium sp.]|nr:sugar ABC transporter permease [Microbacterium sp.]